MTLRHQPPVLARRLALFMVLFAVALGLRQVFSGSVILNPVAIQLGSIAIRWYGLIMAVAIAASYLVAERRLLRAKVSRQVIDQLLWWAIVSGLVGARLGFVVQNIGYYQHNLGDMLAINQGGLSIHGAVILGALGVFIIARRAKLSFLTVADALAPAVLLGAVIGRLGNFTNYELYGYPTSVAWKMFVPFIYRLPGFETSSYFHPTFLYESIANLIIFFIILRLERKVALSSPNGLIHKVRRPGTIFLLTIAGYSVSRFIVEFFRIGTPLDGGLTLAQWVSIGVILTAAIVIFIGSRTVKKKQQ